MDQNKFPTAAMEEERETRPSLLVEPYADCSRESVNRTNTNFAQLNTLTLRYLFPHEGYAATCRSSGHGRRCKTPSLGTLWSEMNESPKILVKAILSDTDFLLPTKLLCERSAWFSAKISQLDGCSPIVFPFADSHVFESVLRFMCTGILQISDCHADQPDAAFEMAMVACRLKMEDLEWCAVGKLEDYFEVNNNTYLHPDSVEYVLRNTASKSHLREWLADHVGGSLSTGTIRAETIARFMATAPDFAIKIIMSMQITVVGTTNALLDMDISDIEWARHEVMDRDNGGQGFLSHEDVDDSDEEEAGDDPEPIHANMESSDNREIGTDKEDNEDDDEEENEHDTENEDEEEGSDEDVTDDDKENEPPSDDEIDNDKENVPPSEDESDSEKEDVSPSEEETDYEKENIAPIEDDDDHNEL
ncbi:hypothetical protein GJ744_006204 [Endocarpon pusillum]|uniref:BTB domain-containing protein n=1 Tax=Endocarpon pusillum TaxID=364733 RepID=A0A8H7APE6_9EURO|nr:hypothetical protein GJ744_006204 [Endocarpon pusillum]